MNTTQTYNFTSQQEDKTKTVNGDFAGKNICVHRVWNPQPTDSSLLDLALPFLQGFASLQSITLPLMVASTQVDH